MHIFVVQCALWKKLASQLDVSIALRDNTRLSVVALVVVAGHARNRVKAQLCVLILLCDDFKGDNMMKNSKMSN